MTSNCCVASRPAFVIHCVSCEICAFVVCWHLICTSQLTEWTTTYSVSAYQQYFQHPDVKQSNDTYMTRIRQTQTDYHTRPFVHDVTPNNCSMQCSQHPVDDSIAGKNTATIAKAWLGKLAPSVPLCNRECGVAAAHAQQAFGIDPVHDGLRVMFVKAFKVASTSAASVFYRLAVTHNATFLGFVIGHSFEVCQRITAFVTFYQ